jgi:Domain of unknown function (DUF4282)
MSTPCRNCGFLLDEDDAFCGNCGQTVTAGQPAAGAGRPGPGAPEWGPARPPESDPGRARSRPYEAGGEAFRAQEQAVPGMSPGPAAGYPGPAATGYPAAPRAHASSKGFVASLFDFGFTSFVTPTVIRVLYVLIMIVLALVGLGSVIVAFAVNKLFGIFTLIIAAPLSFFISLALYRIILELFMVVFRASDDIRAMRERGDFR